MDIKRAIRYFSITEWALWASSTCAAAVCFCVFDGGNYISLAATLVGITSLIFIAKGNPVGQALTIIFAALYAVVSYSYRYYGEMITYLGMSVPMAAVALVGWLRNPYNGNRAEVRVNVLHARELGILAVATAAVTAAFYFILRAFGTANLVPSTLSVATSFSASYLVFRRSRLFAIVYAANDIVLIVLWALATTADPAYVSTLVCFCAFFAHDVYSFINWKRMRSRQTEQIEA